MCHKYFGLLIVIVLLSLLLPVSVVAQNPIRLGIKDSDIDASRFRKVRVAVGVWDSLGRFVPGIDYFSVKEDAFEWRKVKPDITNPNIREAEFRGLTVSFVVDIDPKMPPERIKSVQDAACWAVERFAMQRGLPTSDQVEIWMPGTGDGPIFSQSDDSGAVCSFLRKPLAVGSPYILTINEILHNLLIQPADSNIHVIVMIPTRKIEQGISSNEDIIKLRDAAHTRPIYVFSFLDRTSEQVLTDRNYLIRLSTDIQSYGFRDLAEPGLNVQELVSELIGDVYKYKKRYILEYQSEILASDEPHTLTIKLNDVSETLLFTLSPEAKEPRITIPSNTLLVILGAILWIIVGLSLAYISLLGNRRHVYP